MVTDLVCLSVCLTSMAKLRIALLTIANDESSPLQKICRIMAIEIYGYWVLITVSTKTYGLDGLVWKVV